MYNFKNNINILSVPIHKLAREIKHRTEDTFFLKYTMIELVTRNSMMLDYVWSCCCFECDCQNETATGYCTSTRTVRYYDIVLHDELNRFEMTKTLNTVKN